MSKIKTDVEQFMTGMTSEEGVLTSHFLFPENFTGFAGHFPARKILPGVCQIQCALTTLEKAKARAAALREIVQAKYLAPVSPGEEITCVLSGAQEKNGEWLVKAVITKKEAKVAELKLRVSFDEAPGGRQG